ncbi:DUF4185 domain-containing protein [Psychromicrobium lacuslunae]|uniref:DUF4185 domain-containing protein n=1 Tax=Psychromicrobium lacuslunae TaxID=1618207 RepID=A0A0D4BWN6_9MICC|nr:DUF4185 domain-containing protein [Psychromicrobium lacuslunae]AJT40734.1 hypothetical protein UM93_02960 [Psychromicrobium lacuslunae]
MPSTPISRKAFVTAAAGSLAAVGLGASAVAPAQAAGPIVVKKVKDLTGPGLTTAYRMEATDLGIPARTPDGRTLYVFGDTFEQAHVGGGWWRSPVALWSNTTDLASGVTWSGAVGGAAAEQLWAYEHNNAVFSTVLPSDVITIGNSMYLHVMVNKGLGNVVWTEIWRSDDSGAHWVHTGAKFASDLHGGLFQLLTWGLGNDGYVYIYSTGFQRDKPIIMHRVKSQDIANPAAYQPWGYAAGSWGWGNPPTPILNGKFGEMSLRPLGGKWILTWFCSDDDNWRIDGIIMDSPTSNLYTAKRRTLINHADWGSEDDSHVAQLYGGYVIPGSTLDDLHLSVSQWNTSANWPYRVMQFRVKGFGSS